MPVIHRFVVYCGVLQFDEPQRMTQDPAIPQTNKQPVAPADRLKALTLARCRAADETWRKKMWMESEQLLWLRFYWPQYCSL